MNNEVYNILKREYRDVVYDYYTYICQDESNRIYRYQVSLIKDVIKSYVNIFEDIAHILYRNTTQEAVEIIKDALGDVDFYSVIDNCILYGTLDKSTASTIRNEVELELIKSKAYYILGEREQVLVLDEV